MRERRALNKLYALSKFGNKCIKCNSKNKLQFDHVNRNNKSIEISDMFAHSREKLDKELKKCQLLCEDCHIEKTFIDMGYRKHGTLRGYRNKKCRCNLCKKAWENYKVLHAQRRREARKLHKYFAVS